MKTLHLLNTAFRGYRPQLVLLVLFGFLSAILDGIGINMLVPFISFLTGGGGPLDAITRGVQAAFAFFGIPFGFQNVLIFMAALFLARAATLIAFSYVRARIVAQFLERESSILFRGTLHAKWPFLLRQEGGYLQNTLFWDVKRAGTLLDVVAQAVQSWSGCLVYLVIAFMISPLVTTVTIVAGAAFIFLFRPLIRKTRFLAEATGEAEKRFSQHLMEHVAGIKNVKAAAKEDAVYRIGEKYVRWLGDAFARSALVHSLGTVLIQPFSFIFMLGVFALAYTSGDFNLAGFAATIYLIQKIFTYLQSGQASLHSIQELAPFSENITRFKAELAHEQEVATAHEPFVFTQRISFDSVSFAYPERAPVLSNISFDIPKGAVVALIGPSGGGKTTIADLLLRLVEPSGGRIMLDDTPLELIGLQAWREQIGYVTQDTFMKNASIAENIRFYRPELNLEDIYAAARKAHIDEVIQGLPDGYDTLIGDRGMMVSGGQRQRLALARALAGQPALLVLDEATSALDADSQREIQKAIDALRGTLTVFVIAHRLSTIEGADRIIVLEQGRIVESGSPAELRADPLSYYATHYRLEHTEDTA